MAAALAAAMFVLAGCDGDTGPAGPAGPPGPGGGGSGESAETDLDRDEDAPGVNVAITALSGGTGAGGSFQVGDTISVTYTLQMDDGSDWDLSVFNYGRTMVSGPSYNYQRVIEEQSDMVAASVANADGSYTYTFPVPIPAAYAAPLNDTESFGSDDGEMTGDALLDGTYTLGMYFGWNYTVGEGSFRDVGNATIDFLLGDSAVLSPREVVTQANCNACHESLQMHGGLRREVKLCLLCHTSGAEDRNVPEAAGGTPGVAIDFKVMIHKIHNAEHLPSVLGVTTRVDGSRRYDATPVPYEIVGYGDSVHDFSHIAFPVWPNLSHPMPRDAGYSDLDDEEQDLEDEMRTGVTTCAKCHGDPDGAGPLPAPAQGALYQTQPTRRACGACHDDIVWSQPYTSNLQTMPAQDGDDACKLCHEPAGAPLAVLDAHRHPLHDTDFHPGLNINLLQVLENGDHDGDGTVDVGEKVRVRFRLADDAGDEVDAQDVSALYVALMGPTWNNNHLLYTEVPTDVFTGDQPYACNLPMLVSYEYVGDSTAGLDVLGTTYTPHWDPVGAGTSVWARTATAGGSSVLSAGVTAPQNFIDVDDPTGFARNDNIVIADGGFAGLVTEEYLKIQWVDANRLWFSSPYTSSHAPNVRFDHAAGTTVEEVTLTAKTEDVDYTLNASAGTITELVEFGDGAAVVVTYTADFVMPATYPIPFNDMPDLDETWGEWAGKSIADGTYTLGMWGYNSLTLDLHGESNSYRGAAEGQQLDFLVGSATTPEEYDLISSGGDTCLKCHDELRFHGGSRRGFKTCIMCHGTAGSEDRTRYVAANAPDTTGVSIKYSSMLHKIHMGEELANASTWTVVGFGSGYPNNFSEHTYEHVGFPAMPGGVQRCAKCHGSSDAWQSPADRAHPTEQGLPVVNWGSTCGSCHDSDAAQAHIATMTDGGGNEACVVCHGPGTDLNVELMHKTR